MGKRKSKFLREGEMGMKLDGCAVKFFLRKQWLIARINTFKIFVINEI